MSAADCVNAKAAWEFFLPRIGNAYGTAGLLGNLYTESKISPTDLEGTYCRKLGMTGRQYTDAVDSGSYPAETFFRDRAGYGIAQWTFWTRKQALYEFAKARGKSIGDLQTQMEYLWEELQKYKAVMEVLPNATSVREASDIVCVKFENPAHQEERYLQNRANFGQSFYDRFAGGGQSMNTAGQVAEIIADLLNPVHGYTTAEIATRIAEACLGWPYVWGGAGQYCTPANRESYAGRSSCPDGEAREIRNKCQRLRGAADTCGGCRYYPGGTVRFFDCRGFTRWVLAQVGVTLDGAGATSQWNTGRNWQAKGLVSEMPTDGFAVVFMQNTRDHKTMEHTGLYIGNGIVIHCSGEVKYGSITDKGWTHYAIPAGMDGNAPVNYPTIRKGSTGEYVKLAQTRLQELGYNIGASGADGKFGAKTAEAVRQFQADRELTADGIIGKKTWEALLEEKKPVLYTVTVQHLTEAKANEITAKYGGEKRKEGE